jgi:hypothetical protein
MPATSHAVMPRLTVPDWGSDIERIIGIGYPIAESETSRFKLAEVFRRISPVVGLEPKL